MDHKYPPHLLPIEFDISEKDFSSPVFESQTLSTKVSEDVGVALEFTPAPKSEKKFKMVHEGGISIMVLADREDMTLETAEALKRFPHVLEKIRLVWGRPAFFHKLMEEFVVMEGHRQAAKRGDGRF